MLFIRELLIVIFTIGGSVQSLNENNGEFKNSTIETECAENGKICRDHNQCCSKFCEVVNGIQTCGSSSDLVSELEPSGVNRPIPTEYCTPDKELTLNCTECCSQYCRFVDIRFYVLPFCYPHPYEEKTQHSQTTEDPESFWSHSEIMSRK